MKKNSSGSLSDIIKCLITINTRTEALMPIEGVTNTRNGGLNWVSEFKTFDFPNKQGWNKNKNKWTQLFLSWFIANEVNPVHPPKWFAFLNKDLIHYNQTDYRYKQRLPINVYNP